MVGAGIAANFRGSRFPVVVAILVISGCGGSDSSQPPAEVSLVVSPAADIQEAADQTVIVTVKAEPTPPRSLLVPLEYSGTATRDYDYTSSADVVVIPANTASVDVEIDVYRDFDAEEDETISIRLGEVQGNGELGATAQVQLNILDGGPAGVDKMPDMPGPGGPDAVLFPSHFIITEDSIDFGAIVAASPFDTASPGRLIAEYSSDLNFSSDVYSLGVVDIPPFDPGFQFFPEPHAFSLPLSRLLPNESYYIRMYLNEPPEQTDIGDPFGSAFMFSFATNAQGSVTTRCEAPVRSPAAAPGDPLFDQQWHLQNTGQSAFAENPGIPGADLQMAAAIAQGRDGDGVKLAIVDTGLETCHPDLAANIEEGKSFNFLFHAHFGALPTDPFNTEVLGDHGTSVAGVAAAVANNGLGGRGVAAGVELRGFNLATNLSADTDLQLFNSLGASSSNPDSASADIFNMSFGIVLPAQNPEEDFVRLLEMGTSELRAGRGALYVKAAGNAFDLCDRTHPLNTEVGCIGSNADPDQNLPYMINVGAFNATDVKSSYSSAGANIWVVGPGGEDGVEHPAMITTDQAGVGVGFSQLGMGALIDGHPLNTEGDYISAFGGTSSAAPATAGAIAILLGVNPDLTWRDVKHVLAATARRIDPDSKPVRAAFNGTPFVLQPAWLTNAAGYSFHNWYGFGAVAVDAAVAMAQTHTPDSLGEFVQSPWFHAADMEAAPLEIPDNDGAGVTHSLDVIDLPNTANLEAVVMEIRVNHFDTWDLGIELTSPSGTVSVLNAPFNSVLSGFPGLRDWQLMSNAFYGESPNGTWTVRVVDLAENDVGRLSSWRLRFYYGDHP